MTTIKLEVGIEVLCTAHRSHITLTFFEGSPRIRHSIAGDRCDSQRFAVREITHVDRNEAIRRLSPESVEVT